MSLTYPSRRTITFTASVLAFVMTVTAGAPVAASHHDVTIEVDGVSAPIPGFLTIVDDVLASAGVKLGVHDLLAPSGQSRVKDGETIVVRTATEYEVKIGGKPMTVWSTTDSVDAILDSLAEPGEVVLVAAGRSNVCMQMPFASTRGPVEIFVDSQTLKVDAGANDTADVPLTKANVSLGQLDTLDFYVQGGHTSLKAQRIVRGSVTEISDTPFSSEEQEDGSMYMGEKKVIQGGVDGPSSSTYYHETINGEATIDLLLSKTQTAPVNETVSVGTKEKPSVSVPAAALAAPVGSFSPSSVQGIVQSMAAARGWFDSEFNCLVAPRDHESRWRTNAGNLSGVYGIPQALPGLEMASAGADWATNPVTQIIWGLGYISGRYDMPCSAYGHWQSNNWC